MLWRSAGYNTQLRERHQGQATKMSCTSLPIVSFSLRKRSPQILKLNQTKDKKHTKTKVKKPNQTPKLSISFMERKEMRPNSPLTGNSTVFNKLDVELMGPI